MRLVETSLARNLTPDDGARELVAVDRAAWRSGDYVVAEVLENGWPPPRIESASGRLREVGAGDLVLGALGERRATLEVVGDWRDVGPDLEMTTLTRAGVFGRCRSVAAAIRPLLVPVVYRGHLAAAGRTLAMRDVALPRPATPPPTPPVVLLIASSMSAGKTTTAAAIIRRARGAGLRVAGAKLVGVGRYADVLAMADAGADPAIDFVDAGLPSTIAPEAVVRDAVHRIVGALGASAPDLLVLEVGASPLEPYRGDVAIAALGDAVAATVLCASDAYAVRGVIDAFGMRPDMVAGRVAATSAGVDLVARLTGLDAVDVTDPASGRRIDALVERAVGASARY
jgi:hypothetical protein